MVFDKVKEIIIDQLDVDGSAITPDTSLTKTWKRILSTP